MARVVSSALARHATKPTMSAAATTNAPMYATVRRNGMDAMSLVSAVTDHVPRSAYSMQKRLGKALVDLAPQPRDVHVDHIGLRIEIIVPHVLQQHGARDHLTGVAHE